MAKKKRQAPAKAETTAAAVRPAPASTAPALAVIDEPPFFTIRQYLLLNVIFDAFCIVQLIIVRLMLHETRGLYFFFGLLMAGFLLVSIFDYVYDRTAGRTAPASDK